MNLVSKYKDYDKDILVVNKSLKLVYLKGEAIESGESFLLKESIFNTINSMLGCPFKLVNGGQTDHAKGRC